MDINNPNVFTDKKYTFSIAHQFLKNDPDIIESSILKALTHMHADGVLPRQPKSITILDRDGEPSKTYKDSESVVISFWE